jgi:hypothetical protein
MGPAEVASKIDTYLNRESAAICEKNSKAMKVKPGP